MYKEYQTIHGLLHYRTIPKGPWIMMSYEDLSHMVVDLREENRKLLESTITATEKLQVLYKEDKLDILGHYMARMVELLEEISNETPT